MARFLASLLCALSVNTASAQRDMSLCLLLSFPLLRMIRRALSALVMACRSAIAALSLDSEYGGETECDWRLGKGGRHSSKCRNSRLFRLVPKLGIALFDSALTGALWVWGNQEMVSNQQYDITGRENNPSKGSVFPRRSLSPVPGRRSDARARGPFFSTRYMHLLLTAGRSRIDKMTSATRFLPL